jgi:hypothetical protein
MLPATGGLDPLESGLTSDLRVQVDDPRDAVLVKIRIPTKQGLKHNRVQRRLADHPGQACGGLVRDASLAVQQSTDRRMVDSRSMRELPLRYATLLQRIAH